MVELRGLQRTHAVVMCPGTWAGRCCVVAGRRPSTRPSGWGLGAAGTGQGSGATIDKRWLVAARLLAIAPSYSSTHHSWIVGGGRVPVSGRPPVSRDDAPPVRARKPSSRLAMAPAEDQAEREPGGGRDERRAPPSAAAHGRRRGGGGDGGAGAGRAFDFGPAERLRDGLVPVARVAHGAHAATHATTARVCKQPTGERATSMSAGRHSRREQQGTRACDEPSRRRARHRPLRPRVGVCVMERERSSENRGGWVVVWPAVRPSFCM